MKVIIKEVTGRFGDESAIGKVHLEGPYDSTICGLAYEEYEMEETKQKITCSTCQTFYDWAKSVMKIKR